MDTTEDQSLGLLDRDLDGMCWHGAKKAEKNKNKLIFWVGMQDSSYMKIKIYGDWNPLIAQVNLGSSYTFP